MLRLIGIAISIGIADSLNPTTIAPALYLAGTDDGAPQGQPVHRRRVSRLLRRRRRDRARARAADPLRATHTRRPRTRYILEIIAGAAMLTAAAFLWRHRGHLAKRELPAIDSQGKSSAILGATITAVELPTAFPYFAVIAAIVGSGLDPDSSARILLVLFNVCFVAPLLVIIALLRVRRGPGQSDPDRGPGEAPAQLAAAAGRAGTRRRRVRGAVGRHRPGGHAQPLRPPDPPPAPDHPPLRCGSRTSSRAPRSATIVASAEDRAHGRRAIICLRDGREQIRRRGGRQGVRPGGHATTARRPLRRAARADP